MVMHGSARPCHGKKLVPLQNAGPNPRILEFIGNIILLPLITSETIPGTTVGQRIPGPNKVDRPKFSVEYNYKRHEIKTEFPVSFRVISVFSWIVISRTDCQYGV